MKVGELFATLGLEVSEESFERGNELIEGVHHALEALAVFEGVHMLADWVKETTEAAVEAKHLGERLGVTAEAVQELGYAADVTGASSETMTAAMTRLAAGMEHAKKKGTGPLVDGLAALGVHMSELKGENLDQNLEVIADGFKNAGPEVNKLGVAVEIFGRNAGPRLIPLLNRGADGIKDLRQEAEELGVVIDDEMVERFEQLEISEKKLGATLKGLRNEAVAALLPTLLDAADGIMKWVKANRELIKQKIEQTMRAVIEVGRVLIKILGFVWKAFQVVTEIIGRVIEAFDDLTNNAGTVENVMIGAAIAVGAAWVLASLPFIALLAGIAAVILVVQDLWSWMNGGDSVLKNLYNAFVQYLGDTGVGKVILGVIAGIKAVVQAAIEATQKLVELGHSIGRHAAIIHLRNQFYEEIAETERGKSMSPEEIQAEALQRARAEVAANELIEDQAEKTAVLNAKGLNSLGKPLNVDPWNISRPTLAGPGSTSTSTSSTFAPVITIQGVAGGANEVAGAVLDVIRKFHDDQVADAAHATRARGGKIP